MPAVRGTCAAVLAICALVAATPTTASAKRKGAYRVTVSGTAELDLQASERVGRGACAQPADSVLVSGNYRVTLGPSSFTVPRVGVYRNPFKGTGLTYGPYTDRKGVEGLALTKFADETYDYLSCSDEAGQPPTQTRTCRKTINRRDGKIRLGSTSRAVYLSLSRFLTWFYCHDSAFEYRGIGPRFSDRPWNRRRQGSVTFRDTRPVSFERRVSGHGKVRYTGTTRITVEVKWRIR